MTSHTKHQIMLFACLQLFLHGCSPSRSSTRRSSEGENCTATDDCQSTLRCVEQTCERVPCSSDEQCPGGTCGTSGVCEAQLVPDTVSTDGPDEDVHLGPSLAVFVAEKPAFDSDTTDEHFHEFSAVTPGLGQSEQVKVRIRNLGGDPLQVTKVAFLETNTDGTARSPWVTLDWGSIDPAVAIPFTATNDSFGLEFQVRYEPGAECVLEQTCGFSATLLIEHTDPGAPPVRLAFGPPKCRREPKVDPPEYTFVNASMAKPETQTFKISNTGTCSCAVSDVYFTEPTNRFVITRAFANGIEIEGGESLEFTVTYTPGNTSGGDAADLSIEFDCLASPLIVPLNTSSEVGAIEVTYDGMKEGHLDFTAVTSGCEERTISIFNVGPSTMTIQDWSILEDPAGEYYTIACEFPPSQVGASPTPVPNAPAGLAAGRTLDCIVKYCATTPTGKNATISFSYRNPAEGSVEVQALGGKPN